MLALAAIQGQGEPRKLGMDSLLVKDLMSKEVLAVDSGSNVKTAVKIMVDNEIGSVVTLKSGVPVGLFTERDLLKVLIAGKDLSSAKLSDVSSAQVSRIEKSRTAFDAARMIAGEKGRLLVFDGEKLAGIVSATDVVKAIYRSGIAFELGDAISKTIVTADMNEPIRFAIQQMSERRVGSVIVTEANRPRAIFTERDLLNRVLYVNLSWEQSIIDVSTFPIITAELGINARDVAGVMVTRRIKRLPLVAGGKVVGMVSARDLVEACVYPGGIRDPDYAMEFVIRYGELCPLCGTRIDDRGLCACGAGGD